MFKVSRLTMATAVALVLASCGGDGGGGGNGATEPGGATPVALSAADNTFQPSALTVGSGDEIELTNEGQALHNLTIEGTDVNQDVEAGQSVTIPVDIDAGEYTMFCSYHRAEGMEGTITVQ
jgi:plastocyanin